jgi:hypothetical protein
LVEIEVRRAEIATQPAESTNLDVNEIIGKVRTFVDSMKEMSANGEPMAVSVEAFNGSLGEKHGEYEFAMKLSLVFKPKVALA